MWDIFPWVIILILAFALFGASTFHCRYRLVLERTTAARVNQTEDKYSELLMENRSIAAENEELKLKVRIAMMYAEDDQAVALLLKKHRETLKASNTCTICNRCKEGQQDDLRQRAGLMGAGRWQDWSAEAKHREHGGPYGFPF